MKKYLQNGLSMGRQLILIAMATVTAFFGMATLVNGGLAIFHTDETASEAPSDHSKSVAEVLERDKKSTAESSRAELLTGTGVLLALTLGSFLLTAKVRRVTKKKLHESTEKLANIESKLQTQFQEKQVQLSEEFQKRQLKKAAERTLHQRFMNQTHARLKIGVLNFTVLGGAGWDHLVKKQLLVTIDDDNLYFGKKAESEEIVRPLSELANIQIAGAGTVQRGGGFAGGGFGGEGFIVGASIAGILNLLTTRSTTETVVYLRFKNSELVLLNRDFDIEQMRIRLSPLFLSIEGANGILMTDVSEQLHKLSELRRQWAISDDEFARAKTKILNS